MFQQNYNRRLLNLPRQLASSLLNFLLPPLCIRCKVSTLDPHGLCMDCWKKITFISEPLCQCCGIPFPFQSPFDHICAACHRQRPAYDQARSATVYDDETRALILAFKHGDKTHLAKTMALWLYQCGKPLLSQADYLVPVPLHWTRLISRRYNQAGLIAHYLSDLTGVPVLSQALVRPKQTASQGLFGRKGRLRNVRGAFQVNDQYSRTIHGKNILLVDDVQTTGATIDSCSQALKKSGTNKVFVLTVSRAVLTTPA